MNIFKDLIKGNQELITNGEKLVEVLHVVSDQQQQMILNNEKMIAANDIFLIEQRKKLDAFKKAQEDFNKQMAQLGL